MYIVFESYNLTRCLNLKVIMDALAWIANVLVNDIPNAKEADAKYVEITEYVYPSQLDGHLYIVIENAEKALSVEEIVARIFDRGYRDVSVKKVRMKLKKSKRIKRNVNGIFSIRRNENV